MKKKRQSTKADADRIEAADRMHSAAIHLLRYAAKEDASSGVGPARLSALSVLVFGGPRTLGELAAAERVKPPTMSRVVAGMERSGLATIEKDSGDARRIHIRATAKGERILQQARQRRIDALVRIFRNLSQAELGVLVKAAEIVEGAVRR